MNNDAALKIKKQLRIMLAIVAGMFLFCFALVPLYSVFCKVTGLNGKTAGQVTLTEDQQNQAIDYSRTVTVQLIATLNDSLPSTQGVFDTKIKKYTIHPGEYIRTAFWVENKSLSPKVVQAIPSVTPGLAAEHVRKIECFCFQNQPLEAAQGKNMPLVFTVDPALPNDIHTLTLAYTLFDVTQK